MIKRYTRFLLLFVLVISNSGAFAQTTAIERYRDKLYSPQPDTAKRQTLLAISNLHHSLAADSLLKYIEWGLSLSQMNSSDYFQFKNLYCIYLFKTGEKPASFVYADSLYRLVEITENSHELKLNIFANRVSALIRNDQYKDAIKETLWLLDQGIRNKDTITILKSYSLLGWADMELENYTEAISWLKKGATYTHDSTYIYLSGATYNNLGSCYNELNKTDSALHFVNAAIRYSKKSENLMNQSNGLNIRASILIKKLNYADAANDLEEALKLREQIGDPYYIISDMAQLASFYASVKLPEKGIAVALKGIELAEKGNRVSKLIFLNTALAENYKIAGREKDYANTLLKIIDLKDSLYRKNSEGAIAEMIIKYELQSKENIINQQENIIIKNKFFYLGTAAAFILSAIFIWLVYRNYHHQQRSKMEKALAEEKKHTLLAVHHAEEKERKRIAADLHDNLGSYAAAIASNIGYLKEGVKQENAHIISQLDENAQGIVTQLSDSIWVLKNEHLPVTKLADRFKSWAQKLMQSYPHIKYFYEEDITHDREFPPYKILNIFLILKECLNNSVKHSNCSEIKISFSTDETLKISIEDNGKGFQTNIIHHGNGIENIKHRARECNLQVEWNSIIPSGTQVLIIEDNTN